MKTRQVGILIVLLLLQTMAVFAVPVIQSFRIQFAYPAQIQILWRVTDDTNLSRIEIFKDGKFIYKEEMVGNDETSLYQMGDDNKTHTFELKVYNIFGELTNMTKKGGGDRTAPNIVGSTTIFSNSKQLKFQTDEIATCKGGFTINSLKDLDVKAGIDHTAILDFKEGSNKVFVKCMDEYNNPMSKYATLDFNLDTTKPGMATTFNFSVNNGKIRITWNVPSDISGIASYVIYSSLKQLATTNSNYWDATTNDSVYFISAVDKAGNEGDKAEYGFKRDFLLNTEIKNETKEKPKGETKETTGKISTISIIAWTIFGVLVIALIIWKIYEYKTDKHGLRRYLRQRRKMREI